MVDFQSRYRLYALGYTSPIVREHACKRHHAHEVSRHVHRHHGDRPVHDCRPEVIKELNDPGLWEAQLLASGLNESYKNSESLHTPIREESSKQKNKGGKKLFETGSFGSGVACFKYPRGLMTSRETCDVIVADTQNHCIKVFNQCGVFKHVFGSKGKDAGQFNEPTGVCELPNGDLVIADRRNKRVQVFTSDGNFKYMFPTVQEPYGITSNSIPNIIVSTVSKQIEVYERTGKRVHIFTIGGKCAAVSPVQICTNDKNEIIVCDPDDCLVKFYTLDGDAVHQFQPDSPGVGQAVVPGGICMNRVQQVLVADSLNHTVNSYLEKGAFVERIVCPTDDVGTIQAICCGPEGHLVTTEFSVSKEHCLKIFRYLECECHRARPPSCKRTPNSCKAYQIPPL
ncbi:tripartite motif-containing protein 2-like [Gigantopelta aegis]|uniref:tripartite motif-containing protein 2-like n=1 Tax=Gigantopelta aegis TaxID=1735272 RepID=UPI001B88CB4D|nr:tripartite motif-containing protein 2-like [Gigantopelta aegis]